MASMASDIDNPDHPDYFATRYPNDHGYVNPKIATALLKDQQFIVDARGLRFFCRRFLKIWNSQRRIQAAENGGDYHPRCPICGHEDRIKYLLKYHWSCIDHWYFRDDENVRLDEDTSGYTGDTIDLADGYYDLEE